MKPFMLVILLFTLALTKSKLLDTSKHVLARQKRWLIWNDGGVSWVQLIFGLGIPIEVKQQAITLGTVMKAFYQLPTNSSVYTRPSIDYERRIRSTSRWALYELLENFMDRYNYGEGKACLLKSICEISHTPLDENTGILAEIMTAILRPSTTKEEFEHHTNGEYFSAENLGKKIGKCHILYPECKISIINQFSKFIT